ncbi:MAG: hypothetical protein WD118_09565 [Phycisphaeraceae bacterium]
MRKGRVLVGVVAAVALLAAGFWYVLLRDDPTPVSVSDAVARFRARDVTGASVASLGRVPRLGVYRYATRGFERFDSLLDGRHDYSGTSTVTVSRTGCGLSGRWDALDERWTAWEDCMTPQQARLRSLTQFHEFYGRSKRLHYRCSGRYLQRMTNMSAGRRWTDRCTSGDGSMVLRGRIVGPETLSVAGQPVDTVHAHIDARLSGQARGTNTIDSWLLRSTGLLVQRAVHSDVRIGGTPLGDVAHRERYAIELRSLKPLR